MFTDIQCVDGYTMCSRIYGVVTDILCSLIYGEGTHKPCVQVCTVWSGLYGVLTDILCGLGHILWSRIYCVLTDIR